MVCSVKWQIKVSTTNFFTLILLGEQQLSTVTISAHGPRDKQNTACVKQELYLTTTQTHQLQILNVFLTFCGKVLQLTCKNDISIKLSKLHYGNTTCSLHENVF